MSIRTLDIYNQLKRQAPLEYALDFDNPGHLVGDLNRQVNRVLIALDATGAVIEEAEKSNAELIIAHHPLIFNKLSAVVSDDVVASRVMRLIKSDISLICMHTNLDAAEGGVNDALANSIGLKNCHVLDVLGCDGGKEYGIGRVGELDEQEDTTAFLKRVKCALNASGLRYAAAPRKIKKVAVGGGSCGSYLEKVYNLGCDAFVTADVKHDVFLTARELGITIVDAGHFSTENPVCNALESYLKQHFPSLGVQIASSNRAPEEFYTGE